MTARNGGFSLIELTVVLVIVGLLAGSLMMSLMAQQQGRDTAIAERQLAEAREALLGFAAANGYLPCPAKSASDGNEDRTGGACTGGKRNGLLPWVTLGLGRTDPWGHLLRYSVTPSFSSGTAYFTLGSAGDITIRTRNHSGSLTDLTRATEPVAAIWTTGRNGYWSWLPDASSQATDSAGSNDDEDTNSSASADGTTAISRPPTPAASPLGEFDDIVVWLPRSLLFNRMIAAGRLP